MLDVWYPNRHLFVPVHIEFDSPTDCAQIVLRECAARGDAYTTSDLDCL